MLKRAAAKVDLKHTHLENAGDEGRFPVDDETIQRRELG